MPLLIKRVGSTTIFYESESTVLSHIYIYIYMAANTYVKQPMPSSSATRRSVVLPA